MARLRDIDGVPKVIKKMRLFTNAKLAPSVERGLKDGGLFLQRESQKIVPVDLNNLRPGAETRNIGGKGFAADIAVMYFAIYSIFVHEDLEAKHKPGKKAKYLEGPAREKRSDILKIIAQESKL